jgi:carboxylesterase
MPGAEPFRFDGDTASVLVLHGFTGTTQSMRYVGEQLNRRYGFTTVGPRLAGHGTSVDDMETTGFLDWLKSAEDALTALAAEGRPVFVLGLSMGGSITLNLAARFKDIVKGAIPVNAPALFLGSEMAGLLCDPNAPARIPGIGSDIKDPNSKELAYSEVPVGRLREGHLLFGLTSNLIPAIKCPVTVIQSREDHVVPARNALDIVNSLTGSDHVRLIWLNESYHVATLDNDKDAIVRHAGEFIRFIVES